jgi:hypothetical protein
VFFVLYAICRLVFLNNLVIALVSLSIYVNVAHFRFVSGVVTLTSSGSPVGIATGYDLEGRGVGVRVPVG